MDFLTISPALLGTQDGLIRDITAETVAKSFNDSWITRFGIPSKVITNQGKQFESVLFKEFSKIMDF